jgi:hypothetical protein
MEAAAPNPNGRPDSANGVRYGGIEEVTAKNALPTLANASVPLLNEDSRGVMGIKNLQLGANGVFISSGKEVTLDSGSQLLLEVTM